MQEAERLGGGPPAEVEERREELEEAIHNSLRTLGEAYLGVKHTQVRAGRRAGSSSRRSWTVCRATWVAVVVVVVVLVVVSGSGWCVSPACPLHLSPPPHPFTNVQAVAALRASPAYLVLDFGAVRGLDATGARTMGMVYSDLMQQGVVLVVAGADHHGIRPLLVAHGLPLPPHPLYWPLELEQPEGVLLTGSGHGSVGGGGGGSSPPLSLALEQAWEEGRGPLDVCGEEGHPPSCLEFASLEEGLR